MSNFPKDFSILRKALSNIAFFILTTKTTTRQNFLSKDDLVAARKAVRKGDVILAGDFRRISRFFTGNLFTHALLYFDDNKCIHANIDGVSTISFDKLFEEYDTLLIMRPNIKSNFNQVIDKVIAFAYRKIGSAYNFYFEYRQDRYICTQLIETSFRESGVSLNIRSQESPKKDKFRFFSRVRRVVKADDLLNGDFEVIFASKGLEKKDYFLAKKKILISQC